jgi:Zn-dependent protease with chaperone function
MGDQNQRNDQDFASLWDFQSEEHTRAIKNYLRAEKGALGVSALMLARMGVSPWGIALTAGWAATLYMNRHRVEQQQAEAIHDIVRHHSFPANDDVHKLVQRLFDKAGLAGKTPVVQICTADAGNKKMAAFNYGAAAVPQSGALGVTADNEVLILIGREALNNLELDELAAILAHEVAHVKVDEAGLSSSFNTVGKVFFEGTGIANILTGRWKVAAPVEAGVLGGKMLSSKAARLDEDRADRNAMALYPHPEAAKLAVEKLHNLYMNALYPAGQNGLKARFAAANQVAFGTHNSLEARKARFDEFYAEVRDFCQQNGFDMTTDAIIDGIEHRPSAVNPATDPSSGPSV